MLLSSLPVVRSNTVSFVLNHCVWYTNFWSTSLHILCGLFMLMSGSATFLVIFHEAASTAVAVPGFDLPAVVSYCVSIQTSPTPSCAGLESGASGRLFPYRASSVFFRYTTAPPVIRTGTPAG